MTRPPPAELSPPQPFLVSILPVLLSPFPAPLPPLLLSGACRQAIHYLNLKPEDDAYWSAGTLNGDVVAKRRELIEAGSLDDIVIGEPHYHVDLEETKCLIPLSLPYHSSDDSLGVVLLWENELPLHAASEAAAAKKANGAEGGQAAEGEEDDSRPGWTFLELQSLSQPPSEITVPATGGKQRPSWYPMLKQAVDATLLDLSEAVSPGAGRRESPPELLEFSKNSPYLGGRNSPPQPNPAAAFASSRPPDEEDEGDESSGKKKKPKTAAEMEDGNGAATPGAYGTADDFWDGWSEDEESGGEGEMAGGKKEKKDDEDGYWAAYDGESQIGDGVGRGEEQEEDERTVEAYGQTSVEATPQAQQPAVFSPTTTRDRSATITPADVVDSTVAPSPPSTGLTPPIAKEQLYFSNTLPPLSPSHFGISPTQQDPNRSHFYTPTASLYSTQSPRPQSMASPTSPEVHHFRHARAMSDVSKALPSFPAFPVRPEAGLSPVVAPPATPSQSSSAALNGTSPRPNKPALSPKPSASKALPPAPSQIDIPRPPHPPTASSNLNSAFKFPSASPSPVSSLSKTSASKTRKGPPAPLSPAALAPSPGKDKDRLTAPPHSSSIPLSPRSPRSPSSSALPPPSTSPNKPTPPRPGSTYFPLRKGSSTAPIPSVPTFPSLSSSSTGAAPPIPALPTGWDDPRPGPGPRPSMAPPPAPPLLQRGRFGSLDSAVTSVTGTSVRSGMLIADAAGLGLATRESVSSTLSTDGRVDGAGAEEDEQEQGRREDDTLRFALAGVWGLYSSGATGGEEREERMRRFERVVGEVLRA
ncbi:hypothetical protein JCM8547_004015 [Rhodosporidiobolus lusitaniae]